MKRTAVGAGLLVALVAVAAMAVGGVGATAQNDDATETNGTFGAEISSFMQASSAEAEGEVDDGMFDAAMQRTDDPEERRTLIERRQQRLQDRQARLENHRSQLSPEDGADVRDRALATHVTVGAASLERSVNGTERAARSAGVDTEALNEIRSKARELRGPEVASLAKNLSGQPSADERGPPIEVPGGGEPPVEASGANNSNDGERPNDVGPDENPGNRSDDGSSGQSGDAGPPGEDDPGNADGRADSDD